MNQQLNKKAERTKVRLKGKLVEKHRLEQGITSQQAAAELMEINFRTYQRAIRGEPISLETANQICEALDLKRKDVLTIEMKDELPPTNVLKQDTQDSDPIIDAFIQANNAIENNMARLGTYSTAELSTVFVLLLTRFGSAIARQSGELEVGYEFVDTAALIAKIQIPDFFESENTDSTESD